MNRILTLLVLPLSGALLVACGGSEAPADPAVARVHMQPAGSAPPTVLPYAMPTSPLRSDDGSFMPTDPQAVPSDPGAQTRLGRYASTAQADQLERSIGGSLVRMTVQAADPHAIDQGANDLYGRLAAMNLSQDAIVLIDGVDLRIAAALVDRLTDAGLPNVWLVTR